MPLTVDRYSILLAPAEGDAEPTEHVVAVIHGDRMRAELEGPQHGIVQMEGRPMAYMALWLWAACLRTKVLVDVKFEDFTQRLLNFEEFEEPVQFPGDPAPEEPLGPTQVEGIASPSASQPSSDPSNSGSTPEPIPV